MNAFGGKKMSWHLANQILANMRLKYPSPQVNVLILGDCNLRDSWYPMDDPAELRSIYAYLFTEARKIKKCHLITSSLIPSVENQENCDIHFNQFDQAMKDLCHPSEFLSLNNWLRTKHGKIKGGLISETFFTLVQISQKSTEN